MKRLRDIVGWKILLAMIIILIMAMAFIYIGASVSDKKVYSDNDKHQIEAFEAGYDNVYYPCEKQDDIEIDGVKYSCYKTEMQNGADGDVQTILIRSDSEYKGDAKEKTKRVRMYGKVVNVVDNGIVFEPYSMYKYKTGTSLLSVMKLIIILGIFTIILVSILLVFFIAYYSRLLEYREKQERKEAQNKE